MLLGARSPVYKNTLHAGASLWMRFMCHTDASVSLHSTHPLCVHMKYYYDHALCMFAQKKILSSLEFCPW